MEIEKKQYLESQTEKIIQSWVGISALLGLVLFMSLTVLDYFATPENFWTFLIYRITVSVFLLLLYFLNKLKRKLSYQYMIVILGMVSSAIAIELMILHFGGHKSIYYAGINLLIVCVLGVLPLNLPVALSLALLLYFIYLFPILLYDHITDLGIFINNNVFILSTITVAFVWRILSQQSITKELELQYELDEDKEKLEQYSSQLEDLVDERTRDLAISEQRYKELFDSANDGIVVFDENSVVVDVNRQFCGMYGFDKRSLIGANLKLLEVAEYQDERNERMKRILNGEALVFETEHYKKNGDKLVVEISSKAIEIRGKLYVQSFHRDITDKKRLLEQLFQAQKMESIGILAGGIAHDFNNFLGTILGNAELLSQNENLDPSSRRGVKAIESSARKAGQIVSKLLSFARKGKFNALPLNFNDVLRDAVELIERVVEKKKVVLKVETAHNIPIMKGDSTQLEQVIMNLVINAADAMPEGGTVTLSTSLENIAKNHAVIHPLLTPGKYVCLRVSDTGTGIPDEIRDHIFDPFFTTKEPGKGTGLGLAIIYGIIREHNGVITVTSLLGRGTTFEVYLPAIESGFY